MQMHHNNAYAKYYIVIHIFFFKFILEESFLEKLDGIRTH